MPTLQRPIVTDSGNGAYVLPRIELPNDDASHELVKQCLEALAIRFDDERVHVDQTMHNAARIIRAPGTWNGKGDSTDDRPHRLADVLAAVSELSPDSIELLRELAAPVVKAKTVVPRPTITTRKRTGFDLEAFIGEYLDVHHHGPKDGNIRW